MALSMAGTRGATAGATPAAGRWVAKLRLVFALGAMLTSAVWLLSIRDVEYVRFDVARWWAVAHLTASSVLLALSSSALRAGASRLDAVALAIELAVVLAWIQLTGSASSALIAVVPVWIVAYRVARG